MNAKPTYEELEQKVALLSRKVNEQQAIENQYRNLVDSTSDSLYLVEADGLYLYFNQNHARRRKMPKNDATCLFYKDIHSPEQNAKFEQKIQGGY